MHARVSQQSEGQQNPSKKWLDIRIVRSCSLFWSLPSSLFSSLVTEWLKPHFYSVHYHLFFFLVPVYEDPQGRAEGKLGQIAKKKNKNCNELIVGLNVCAVC